MPSSCKTAPDTISGWVLLTPILWLEDITGEMRWTGCASTTSRPWRNSGGDRSSDAAEALEVLDTDARIPYVRRRGDYLYNFWRDATNPRGLWRRTTLQSYRTESADWDV